MAQRILISPIVSGVFVCVCLREQTPGLQNESSRTICLLSLLFYPSLSTRPQNPFLPSSSPLCPSSSLHPPPPSSPPPTVCTLLACLSNSSRCSNAVKHEIHLVMRAIHRTRSVQPNSLLPPSTSLHTSIDPHQILPLHLSSSSLSPAF